MKLALTIGSLALIWISTMTNPDLSGFFSNMIIFFAMYLSTYFENEDKYKKRFLNVMRTIMVAMMIFCIIAWAGLFELNTVKGQVYLRFGEGMRLGDANLLNMHWVFGVLVFFSIVVSLGEYINKITDDKYLNSVGKMEGAK